MMPENESNVQNAESTDSTERRPFAAVLLAGGKSSRMGFDKATLEIDGAPLWERQMRLLQSLDAAEIHISGPQTGPWAGSGFSTIEDAIPHLGPMGGLVSILRKVSTPRIVILAVDMPAMTANFLHRLLLWDQPVVPKIGDFYEPLAAIYARSDLAFLEAGLTAGERSLQIFLHRAVEQGRMLEYPVPDAEIPLFANWNSLPQLDCGSKVSG